MLSRPVGKPLYIGETRVIWDRRDLTQISDKELARIHAIVDREQDGEIGRRLETVFIESEYLDRDQVRYSTTTRIVWAGGLDHLTIED